MTTALTPVPVPAVQVTYLKRQFDRRRTSVGQVRRFVHEAITGRIPADRVEDIVVCASELATNALQHTPPGRQFLVCLTVAGSALRLEVHDAGGGAPQVCGTAKDDERGRGLFLVSALSDDWGTSRRDGPGKIVWAAFLPTNPNASEAVV